MRKFQDTFETRKQSFISVFSICMTVPLKYDPRCFKLKPADFDMILFPDVNNLFDLMKNNTCFNA